MKKIIFGITDLSLGGAERVLVDLTNELSNKYDITIFTLYPNGNLEKELNKNIKLINYYKKPFEKYNCLYKKLISLQILFFKKYIYKKYIKNKYDVEIAFLEGPITNLFSVKNKNVKKIAWVHTDIDKIFGNNLKAKIKKINNKKIYKNYQKIIFVSKYTLEKFNKTYNISNEKLVINNYINNKRILEKADENIENIFDKKNINFLTVARLVEAKGIDRLIRIHSKLIKKGYSNKMYIIGDGVLKNDLQKLIKELNVEKTFILLGAKENPYPYIKMCDYFSLLSYYEGYGIAIEEAKILNKFIIITDTASKEAVENYNNNIILKNEENEIYEGLKKILQAPTKNDNNQINDNNKKIIKKIIEEIGE